MNERIPTCDCKVRVQSSAGASWLISTSPEVFLPKADIIPLHSAPHPQTQWTMIQSIKVFKLQHPTIFSHLFRLKILHTASANIGNIILFGQPRSPSLPTALS